MDKQFMIMKKNTYTCWFLVITLLAAGCSRWDDPIRTDESRNLQAVISDDEWATRSIVIDNPGIKLESFWKADDRIGVFGSTGGQVAFTVAGNTISQDGKTAEFVSVSDIPAGKLMAYHPYSESAEKSGNGFILNFPDTQHYTMERGVVQPDPNACMMAGTGSKGSGVQFVNLMSVLKVGQVFIEDTMVQSVEFRDLTDSPVCGPFTVSFDSSVPSTTFTGNGKVLKLDLGSEGIRADANSLFIVFLAVPARDYPKGFEITFVAADGKKTVKTVGTRDGKTLHRSVVYPIGDINAYANIPGMTYELKPSAKIMTPDMLDMVKVTARDSAYVYTDEGSYAVDADGNPVKMPYLTLLVHKDMNPQVGNYLLFNHPSTDMPQGGVYKVDQCKLASDGQHWEVYAVPESNFAAPFEQLTIGGPIYDASGNLNPDCGVDIDISSYIREIRDEEGNTVSFQAPHTYQTNAAEAMTRGSIGRVSFSTPDLTLSMDDQSHCTCDVSTKMSVSMRVAIGIIGGELQYIYTKVNPSLQLKTTFAIYGKYEYTQRKHLWTFYTAGIPVGPVVLLPEIGFDVFGGVGGELKFSASTTFNYDLGTYGLMYNKGDGLTFKHEYEDPSSDEGFNPSIPDLSAGLTGNLYAFAGLGMRAGISVYGLCSLGAATDAKLTFGLIADKGVDSSSMGIKLALTPEIDITPYTAVLGGKLSKLWKGIGGKIEFKPLWERYLLPQLAGYAGISLTYTDPISVKLADGWPVTTRVPNGTGPLEYKLTIKGKPLNPIPVAIEVYESSEFNFIYSDPASFSNYMAAGVPHLYSSVVKMVNPKRVFSKIIGLHSEEETVIDFSNKEPDDWLYYPSQSGVAFYARYNLYSGDGELLPWNESDDMYGQVYYWPFRANGAPY